MHKYFGIENLTLDIKSQAKNLGFMSCGISEARFLEEEAPKLEEWLNNNMNGKMSYMERNFDMRLDPRKICLLYTSPSPRDVKRSRMPSSA